MAKKKKDNTQVGRARLNARVWVLAAVLPIALIATYIFFLAPARSNNEAATAALQAAQAQTATYEQRINDLNSGAAPDANLLLERARELDLLLPPEVESFLFLDNFTTGAAASGLVAELSPSGAGSPLTYQVKLTGQPSRVLAFITNLQAKYPLQTITGLGYSGGDVNAETGQEQATATFELTAWNEPAPTLDQAADQSAPTAPVDPNAPTAPVDPNAPTAPVDPVEPQ